MVNERASWSVRGIETLRELLAIMELSAEEMALLAQLQERARTASVAMTRAFYDRLLRHAHTAEYFHGIGTAHLDEMLQSWFVDLFSGCYDDTYAAKRLQIGMIHVRIGLPVRYPLAMLDIVLEHGALVVQASPSPIQATAAFRKVLALDVAIFNQAYEDTELQSLAEMVGGERLARRLLTGHV